MPGLLSSCHIKMLPFTAVCPLTRNPHYSTISTVPFPPSSYERWAIEDHLARGNSTSPITGRLLQLSDLAPNG